jgi:DNA-binding transcriptional regulator YiaG
MKRPLRKSKEFEHKFKRFQKNFGFVVRHLREKRHLSRPELAGLAKFSKTTLGRV